MKGKLPSKIWFPFWVDKWIFGSMRLEFNPAQRSLWIDLMAIAAKDNGYIRANADTPYLPKQLAGLLVYDEKFFIETIEKFIQVGKIIREDSGVLYITNWEKYAGTMGYKRVLKHRFMKASVTPTVSDDTKSVTQNRTEQNRTEQNRIEHNITEHSKKIDQPSNKKIELILDEEPKRWEGITEELKTLWAKTYPGCDIDVVLQEMIAYWDAQPKAKRKINWKMTIVNRLKWLQDHGGTKGVPIIPGESRWLKEQREKKEKIDAH